MYHNINFFSEGSKIAAHLYLPSSISTPLPAIILCHGFAGVKELLLPAFAHYFSENGYAALCFDYRGFGESEGERGRLVVSAGNDSVNPPQESQILYDKAHEPKAHLVVKGASHYEVYEGEYFELVAKAQVEWFGKYLR
jgi:alpha-beta hydrolase superfamily lysophospholipase